MASCMQTASERESAHQNYEQILYEYDFLRLMVAPLAITVAIGAASVLVTTLLGGANTFVPGACERVEPYILSQLVGQELAVYQACDAICHHLKEEQPQQPLVLSLHGPPGVGKSLLHLLLARSLYNKKPTARQECPGQSCRGYKVLYGMNYLASERAEQHRLLMAGVTEHVRLYPQSLIVIEEYDKLDCPTRGLLRQLVGSPHSTNVSINRSIVILESNTGFPQLHQMLEEAGDRKRVSAGAAQRMLKDMMFSLWARQGCESHTDVVKLLSLISFYLPFLPLEREQIQELFSRRLMEVQREVLKSSRDVLLWNSRVLDFLTSQVDFDGKYPIEGGKEVGALMIRYVTRALKAWGKVKAAREEARRAAHQASGSKKRLKKLQPQELALKVMSDGLGLEIDTA